MEPSELALVSQAVEAKQASGEQPQESGWVQLLVGVYVVLEVFAWDGLASAMADPAFA